MRYDHFSMLPEKAFQPRNGRQGMTLEGGGGGGPSTTYTSNVPEWLRPQTEALIGAATQEYFKTELDPETGKYNITGTKPYVPYSSDPRDYFAPFSPQQQAVMGEAQRMRTPGGFMAGQQMTGIAGQGGLETVGGAYGYGGQGAMYGGQAAGMGGMYERMATDPRAIQSYMSPYMQNVVERQKLAAIEDAQRANLGQNLAASRQGTYGGARQALMQAQREAALEKQLGDIQAGGLQSAFDKAQQAQQFGVTTGLQGLQTGIQGAGMGLQGIGAAQAGYGLTGQMGAQAANIGAAQQQADLARLGFQGQMGDVQQQQQQRIIDQAIQNYALAQESPFQRLADYSGLIRGYQSPSRTESYTRSAQSPITQLVGTGIQLGGAAQALGMGRRAGGQIKSYAEGGITSVDALEGMAEKASIPQLQQSMRNDTLPEYIGMPILQNKVDNAERMQMAQSIAPGMGQQVPIADKVMQRANALQGIDSVQTAAGGGIVAFKDGGVARFQNQGIVLGEPEVTQEMLEEERKRQEMFLGVDPRIAKTKELLGKQGQESGLDRAMRGLQYVIAGEKIKREGDTSQLEKITQSEMARRKEMADRQMKLAELEGADYQQRAGIYKDVTGRQREKARVAAEQKFKAGESEKDRQNRLAVANIPAKEIQLAQQLMAKDSTLSYLDAVSKASQALSPKDTYTSTRNALTAAAKAASDEMARLELYNADLRELSKKAAAGDKDAQAKYNDVKKGVEKRVFEQFQVEGVNLSSGTLQRSPTAPATAPATAPKPAAGRFSVTAPDGTTFNFPTQQAADEFRRRIQGQ